MHWKAKEEKRKHSEGKRSKQPEFIGGRSNRIGGTFLECAKSECGFRGQQDLGIRIHTFFGNGQNSKWKF
jgi:hypothetical protein